MREPRDKPGPRGTPLQQKVLDVAITRVQIAAPVVLLIQELYDRGSQQPDLMDLLVECAFRSWGVEELGRLLPALKEDLEASDVFVQVLDARIRSESDEENQQGLKALRRRVKSYHQDFFVEQSATRELAGSLTA